MNPGTEGVQLGHYRLTRRLGAGGMGEVYLARDLALNRDVAIKFVLAEGASDPTLARRLMQEAQAVAALDHPCICPVYGVGVDPDGRPYMVMQYVEGDTLASRLAHGPMPVRDALGLCAHVADALAAAHRRGIIHRDLKPQNIIITPSGMPRLLDFGIAKVLPSTDTCAAQSETRSSLTSAHAMVGTPAYMSPEQVQQRPIDGRSDLFSLGAILFETLTGRRAFGGNQLAELFGGILHTHPPAPSTLRQDLDERHDELIRRLLAKEPADRFQSGDELVGALRLLQPDTSRTPDHLVPPRPATRAAVRWAERRKIPLAIATVVVLAAAIGIPRYFRTTLPAMPANAKVWYDRGTEALREGAFHTAAAAFDESARLFPNHPFTYARLAEARMELDDESGAQKALLSVGALVSNESRLPQDERLRLDAIRALVLRKVDDAVALYRELSERNPSDPAAWVDLGRAQEAAAQSADARASYERAVAVGPQYPAAVLRLGRIEYSEGAGDEALAHFAEAERLYRLAKDSEGQAEVLIWRAALLDGRGEFAGARGELDRALALARAADSQALVVRARIRLSSVTLSEGHLEEAERLASETVQSALNADLPVLAADGLIDFAAVLDTQHRSTEAEGQVRRALDIAEHRGASRTAARARLQLAAVLQSTRRYEESLSVLPPAVEFYKRNNYRAFELQATNIAARSLGRLDRSTEAAAMLRDALRLAERIGDKRQAALALISLSGQAADAGALPEALDLRLKAETIHRAQMDLTQLPFDLSNRAEMLIQVGRLSDAETALRELEQGIAEKRETYLERRRRVAYLRALLANVTKRYASAVAFAKGTEPTNPPDSTTLLARAMADYGESHQAGARETAESARTASSSSASTQREIAYWKAATHFTARRYADALATATSGLALLAKAPNYELEWRLAAVGAAAAATLKKVDDERLLHDRAAVALARLRAEWGAAANGYEARPDLRQLRALAGL